MGATDFASRLNTISVAIGVGASLSAAVDLAGCSLVGIHMPAAWTAAGLTFQASEDGSSFDNLYDGGGTEKSLTVAASRYVLLPPDDWVSVRYLKVRSGTSGVPVNQTGGATLILVVRPRS